MKKYITILYMIVLIEVYGLAQNGSDKYYYYYQNEKQNLELITDLVFVSVVGDDAKNIDLFKNGTGVLKKEGLSDKMKQELSSSDNFYWAEIMLGENISATSYNEKVAALRQNKNIQTVSPYFKSAHGKKIGLTNFFYIKLKILSDTTVLKQYAKQCNTIIVKQDTFMPLWFVLSCTKNSDKNALELANQSFESRLFQYAEPDLMLDDFLNCVNDTYFPQQWGLRNTGQYNGIAGIDIRACDAWNLSTGANINVAVLDQGIQLNHPDLQANIHSLSYDTENGTSPSVVRGDHGTACAGIIGAVGNTAGIRGVAPNCRLMSVSNSLQATTISRMKRAEGINWAIQNGAHIISNSWGSSVQFQIIDDAITNAINNGRNGLGCVIVFATGNDNGQVQYPANSNPNILAVGAVSQCGQRKSFTSCDGEAWGSNFGETLDVVAPGVLIPTTDRTGINGYNPNIPIHTQNGGNLVTTDYTNNDYTVWFNGTSSACPHVAGIAALVLSVNPTLTGKQVRDIIEQTAQKVGEEYVYNTTTVRPNGTWNNDMGYGLVNAFCAVQNTLMRLATISGPSLVCTSGSTYTVNNLPPGDSVLWSCSSNLVKISSSGDSAVFEPNGSGPGQIWATLTYATCGNVTIPAINVTASPGPISIDFDAPPGRFTAMIETVPDAASYKWYCDGVLNSSTTTTARFMRQPDNCEHVYYVDVIAVNTCESGLSHEEVSEPPCYYYSIFPNPASTEISITQNTLTTTSAQSIKKPIKEVRIIDKFGRQALTQSFGDKVYETKLNISKLQTGSYTIQINQGTDMETYTVIKE